MIAAALAGLLAVGSPDAPSTAAQAEAEAFAALKEHHDCDAAAAFMRGYQLSHDQRYAMNAAVAYQRAGDVFAVTEAMRFVKDPSISQKARDRLNALQGSTTAKQECAKQPQSFATPDDDTNEQPKTPLASVAEKKPIVVEEADDDEPPDEPPHALNLSPHKVDDTPAPAMPDSSLAPYGTAAIVAGGVVAAATAGGVVAQTLIVPASDQPGNLRAAMATPMSIALWVSGSTAALLVGAGAAIWFVEER